MAGHQPKEAEELFSVTVNPARAEEGPEPVAGPPRTPPAPALEAGLPTSAEEDADPEPHRTPAPEAIR